MGRPQSAIISNFDYSQWSLDAVIPTSNNGPAKLPPPVRKEPLKLTLLPGEVVSKLLELLYEAMKRENDSANLKLKHSCMFCSKRYADTHQFRTKSWISHAMIHLEVNRFHCHKCEFKCHGELEIKEHLRDDHKEIIKRKAPFEVLDFKFTKEEIREVDKGARKCFIEWGAEAPPIKNLDFLRKKKKESSPKNKETESCVICEEEISFNKRNMYEEKESHTARAHHKAFKLWKCNQCSFGSTESTAIEGHYNRDHQSIEFIAELHVKIATHPERREFSKEVLKCFPNTKIPGIICGY